MTCVICSLNTETPDYPSLLIVSDSLYSHEQGPIFDYGSKILPLTVNLYTPSINGDFDKLSHTQTVGFAYAGSSLIGLNVHALASLFLSYQIHVHNVRISLSDLSDFFARIIEQTIKDYGFRTGSRIDYECIIFGKCQVEGKLKTYYGVVNYTPESFEFSFEERKLETCEDYILLGDKKSEVSKLLKRCQKYETNNIRKNRLPGRLIKALIKSNRLKYNTIGGYLNHVRYDFFGRFWALGQLEPYEQGRPQAYLRILGFNYDDIGVGNCQYGGRGQAG